MSPTAQEVIVFPAKAATAEESIRDYLRSGVVRRSEWVILGFLVYAVGLGALLPLAPSVRHLVTLLNFAILAAYTVLIVSDRAKPAGTFSVARDVSSLALIVLAYREMGWFAQPHLDHTLEASWVAWDRVVLRGGAKAVIESLGPVIPSLLEISYALVYALAPFAVAMLYVYKRRERVDQFLFPSAHVAGAFAAAFGAMRALPERRWVGDFCLAWRL